MDTVVIYHKQRHPKTIPPLVKKLKRRLHKSNAGQVAVQDRRLGRKRDPHTTKEDPLQLTLLR